MKPCMFFFVITGSFFPLSSMEPERYSPPLAIMNGNTGRLSPSTLTLPPYDPEENQAPSLSRQKNTRSATKRKNLQECFENVSKTLIMLKSLLEEEKEEDANEDTTSSSHNSHSFCASAAAATSLTDDPFGHSNKAGHQEMSDGERDELSFLQTTTTHEYKAGTLSTEKAESDSFSVNPSTPHSQLLSSSEEDNDDDYDPSAEEDADCDHSSEEGEDNDDDEYSVKKATPAQKKKTKRLVPNKPRRYTKKFPPHKKRSHIPLPKADQERLKKLKGKTAEKLWKEHLKNPLCKDLSRKGRFIEGTFLPCFEENCNVHHKSQARSFGQTISTHLAFVRKSAPIEHTKCLYCKKKVNTQVTAMVYHWILACKKRSPKQSVEIPKKPSYKQHSEDDLE